MVRFLLQLDAFASTAQDKPQTKMFAFAELLNLLINKCVLYFVFRKNLHKKTA